MKDKYILQTGEQKKTFYSIGNKIATFDAFEKRKVYVTFYFTLSQISEQYERSTFTLFDVCGLVGGVFEIFLTFGSWLVVSIANKQFSFSLISRLYMVKKDEVEYPAKVNPKRKQFSDISRGKREEAKSSISSDVGIDSASQQPTRECAPIGEDILRRVSETIKRHRKYGYRCKHVSYSAFSGLLCK